MKKREGCLLGFVFVCVLVMMVFMTFGILAERKRVAVLDGVRKPSSVVAHKKLAAEIAGEEPDLSEREIAILALNDPFPSDAADVVAEYGALFALMKDRTRCPEVLGDKHPDEWTDEDMAAIRAYLDENRDLLKNLRRLAARGGPARTVIFGQGHDRLMEGISEIRECARLLHAHAIISSLDGNTDEVFADIRAGLQLLDSVVDEPLIISQLVRVAMGGASAAAIRDSISHGGDLSAEQTAELMDMLEKSVNRQAFADGIAGEQAYAFENMEMLKDIKSDPLIGRISQPFVNMNISTYIEILGEASDAAELPYHQALPRLNQIQKDVENLGWLRSIAKGSVPAFTRACEIQARHEAQTNITRIGIQLERYHAEHGSYPDMLEDIAPQLGGPIPVDPFTGQPFRYLPTRDKFTLYSVGSNQTDDGAKHDLRFGDIVWRGVTLPKPPPPTEEYDDEADY